MSLGESFAGPAGLAGAAEPAGGAAWAGTILRAATARPAATAATTAPIVSLRSSVFGIAGKSEEHHDRQSCGIRHRCLRYVIAPDHDTRCLPAYRWRKPPDWTY